jgi:hypothetical protein
MHYTIIPVFHELQITSTYEVLNMNFFHNFITILTHFLSYQNYTLLNVTVSTN